MARRPERTVPPAWLSLVAIGLLFHPGAVLAHGQDEPESTMCTDWPQWRGPNRDGISQETISIWPPIKLWAVNVGYGVSSVIAHRGRVYAMGHRDGSDTVYCLDAETGQPIWQFSYRAKSDQTSDARFPGPRSTRNNKGDVVCLQVADKLIRRKDKSCQPR